MHSHTSTDQARGRRYWQAWRRLRGMLLTCYWQLHHIGVCYAHVTRGYAFFSLPDNNSWWYHCNIFSMRGRRLKHRTIRWVRYNISLSLQLYWDLMLPHLIQMYVNNSFRLTGDNWTWECSHGSCPLMITRSMNLCWCMPIYTSSWDRRKGSKCNQCAQYLAPHDCDNYLKQTTN